MCACPAIPWPVSEMGAACGIAFTPSLAWGSKTRGVGRGSGEILSHVSGVGEESLTPGCLISPYFPFLPQKPCKEVGTLHVPHDSPEEGGDPDPALPRRDAAPSWFPSPLGAVGHPELGAGIPPAPAEAPSPLRGPYPAGCQGARRAALALAAELPAPNNGAIEGLEPGVRAGQPGCGLRTGRTAEPACSTPAELQPKIGAWWPFGGWASLSGGHGLFARGDFAEYLREPGSCANLFLFGFFGVKKAGLLVFLSPPHTFP